MDWVKLSARYYCDEAVANLPSESAELMFVRGLAYCGAEETHGFIPYNIVPSLTRRRRWRTDVDALVAASLWVPHSGDRTVPANGDPRGRVGEAGWWIARWEDWQEELEALARRRAADRERKRQERERQRVSRDSPNNVTRFDQRKRLSRDVSAPNREVETDGKNYSHVDPNNGSTWTEQPKLSLVTSTDTSTGRENPSHAPARPRPDKPAVTSGNNGNRAS